MASSLVVSQAHLYMLQEVFVVVLRGGEIMSL